MSPQPILHSFALPQVPGGGLDREILRRSEIVRCTWPEVADAVISPPSVKRWMKRSPALTWSTRFH